MNLGKERIVIHKAKPGQELELAELRARAMRESLLTVGRYDEQRARARLLDSYQAKNTHVIYRDNHLIGFYVVEKYCDAYGLNHFYLDCAYHSQGLGEIVLEHIKAFYTDLPIRLNALKGSRANAFYQQNGFVKTGEEEFDNHYEFWPASATDLGLLIKS